MSKKPLPFNKFSPCSKCGDIGASVRYWADYYEATHSEATPVEKIIRTCKTCGFTWDELPLDSVKL